MANKDAVKVPIEGENKNLKGALAESRQMIAQFARLGTQSLFPFQKSLTGLVGNLFSVRGAIATLAGTGGIGLLISRSIEAASTIVDTADRIGLGVEAYQELKFAAGEAGVEVDLFHTAMTALVRRQGEAIGGNKGFAEAFTSIGISVQELRSLRPEDLLGRVADGVNNLGSQAEKLAALDKVMSEAGRRMFNFTAMGSEGLARLRQEARDMGLVLDAVMVREAEAAGDQMARVGNIIRTNLTRAILSLSPAIAAAAEDFTKKLGPIVGWLIRQLPDTAVASDVLTERLGELGGAIAVLAGMSLPEILKPGVLASFDEETRNKLVAMLQDYARLEGLLEERVRKEKMLQLALEQSGSSNTVLADKIRKVKEELEFENAQLGRSTSEQRLYSEAKKAGIDDLDAYRLAIGPLIAEHERLKAAVAAAGNQQKIWQENMAAGKAAYDQTRTPLETYQAEIERLNGLLDYGAIAQTTYDRAVLAAQKTYQDAASKTDLLRIAQGELGDVIRDTGNAVLQGNIKSWEDWAQVAVNAIGRVFAAWVEMQQAQAAAQSGGGGGWLGAVFSGASSLFGLFGGTDIGVGNTTGAGGAGLSFTHFGGPRAAGGPVMPGMVYPVGEQGPELFAPTSPGTILSAPASRGLLANAGGGMVVNQTFINPTRDSIPEIVAAVQALGFKVQQMDGGFERRAIGAVTNARGRDPELFGGVA